MRGRMIVNTTCPFCNKSTTQRDEYTVTKRRTKNYFHKECYLESCRRRGGENAEVSSDGQSHIS